MMYDSCGVDRSVAHTELHICSPCLLLTGSPCPGDWQERVQEELALLKSLPSISCYFKVLSSGEPLLSADPSHRTPKPQPSSQCLTLTQTVGSSLPQAQNSSVCPGRFSLSTAGERGHGCLSAALCSGVQHCCVPHALCVAVAGSQQQPGTITVILVQIQQCSPIVSRDLVQCCLPDPTVVEWSEEDQQCLVLTFSLLHCFLCHRQFVLEQCALLHTSPTEVNPVLPTCPSQALPHTPHLRKAFGSNFSPHYSPQQPAFKTAMIK